MYVSFDDVDAKFRDLAEELKKRRDPESRTKVLAQMRAALREAERPTDTYADWKASLTATFSDLWDMR